MAKSSTKQPTRQSIKRSAKQPKSRGQSKDLYDVEGLLRKVRDRRAWLVETEEALRAIQHGQVDALVVKHDLTEKVYALKSFGELEEANAELRAQVEERRRAEEALRQSQDELRGLTVRLMMAQDEERKRISRDLHDDINQRLALLAIDIQTLDQDHPASPEILSQKLQTLHLRVTELLSAIHGLAYELHSLVLDDLGLSVAVQRYVDDFAGRTGLSCRATVTDLPESLPRAAVTCLYQILKECLGNVLKHAKAKAITIELSGTGAQLRLSVQDDGEGFEPNKLVDGRKGLGFVSMRERARMLRGELSVQSRRGEGTTVTVTLPLYLPF